MEVNILDLINIPYVIGINLLTWIVLSKVIINPAKWIKILTSVLAGAILGFIFYKTADETITTLIVSYLVSIVAYNWIIKTILDKFEVTYDNKKGLL